MVTAMPRKHPHKRGGGGGRGPGGGRGGPGQGRLLKELDEMFAGIGDAVLFGQVGETRENNYELRDSILQKRVYYRLCRKVYVELKTEYTEEEKNYKIKEEPFILAVLNGIIERVRIKPVNAAKKIRRIYFADI